MDQHARRQVDNLPFPNPDMPLQNVLVEMLTRYGIPWQRVKSGVLKEGPRTETSLKGLLLKTH